MSLAIKWWDMLEVISSTHAGRCWHASQWGRPSRVRFWRWYLSRCHCWGDALAHGWKATRCWRRRSATWPRTECPTRCPATRAPCCFWRSTSQQEQHYSLHL